MTPLYCAALGYLLGSVSFAVIVSKLFGLADPRTHGSGNPGATNVLRTGNKVAAFLTLLGDAAKGTFAMWLASRLGADASGAAIAGCSAFLGHVFPLFLRFKGGKGVATALGVLLGLSVWLGLACAATWLLTAVVTRYSSLAALVAAVVAPTVAWALGLSQDIVVMVAGMAALLILRHRSNIQRLLRGEEGRIGGKKAAENAENAENAAPR